MKKTRRISDGFNNLAPRVGLEPTTARLTAACSTIELPRNLKPNGKGWKILAPRVGLEPTTARLTAACSTIELPRNRCVLSSNEVYYTDESAQGKNFFENFSDLINGDVPNDYPMTT